MIKREGFVVVNNMREPLLDTCRSASSLTWLALEEGCGVNIECAGKLGYTIRPATLIVHEDGDDADALD